MSANMDKEKIILAQKGRWAIAAMKSGLIEKERTLEGMEAFDQFWETIGTELEMMLRVIEEERRGRWRNGLIAWTLAIFWLVAWLW